MMSPAVKVKKIPVDQAQVIKIDLTKEAQRKLLMKEHQMIHLMEKLHLEQIKIKNKDDLMNKLRWILLISCTTQKN